MSTLRVDAIQNRTGGDLINAKGMARAWVNFNGTGTVAIASAHNVSSITDNGVGDYSLNFGTAMADANYAVVAMCGGASNMTSTEIVSLATGSARIKTTRENNSTTGTVDTTPVCATIFD